MKFVAQWKNYRWVNFYDENGFTRYFESVDEVRAFLKTRHFSNPEVEVTEVLQIKESSNSITS